MKLLPSLLPASAPGYPRQDSGQYINDDEYGGPTTLNYTRFAYKPPLSKVANNMGKKTANRQDRSRIFAESKLDHQDTRYSKFMDKIAASQ